MKTTKNSQHPYESAPLRLAAVFALVGGLACGTARAVDLTLPSGGVVSVELIGSDAAFHNTLSLVSPAAAIFSRGCKLEPSIGLPGLPLLSEKSSQHGCRVTLDADPATPGLQGFPPGTTLRFNMCAQIDADATCDFVWSSNPALNPDGVDHVRTTPLFAADFPGQVFRLNWEDQSGGGDMDFNDFIVVVRVVQDTDGDGLWDDWERFGIDTDGDGVIDLDLPGMGADYRHKDIFLHIDFMDCATMGGDCPPGDSHSHRPIQAAVDAVRTAFANAPVPNPNGVNGINLHVEIGTALAHQNFLLMSNACFANLFGSPGVGDFDAVKAAAFGATNPRRFAFHYCIFTHNQCPTALGGNPCTSSGCGELPGNDFMVSLGSFTGQIGTLQQQAGTLMHEFGHNLGLRHGGGDNVNNKPNYLSLMNYSFQMGGIPPTDPDGPGGLTQRIDYSRAALPSLDESNLSEPAGLGDGTDNTTFICPNGTARTVAGMGAVDWNCNMNTTETGVSVDINGDAAVPCITAGANGVLNTVPAGDDVVVGNKIFEGPNRRCDTTAAGDDVQNRPVGLMTGFNDWANIKYDFQTTADFEDGSHESVPPEQELDLNTFVATLSADLVLTQTATPDPVITGQNLTYTLIVNNNGPAAAANVAVLDDLPAETTFVSCATTGGGVCAGSGNHRTITFASMPGGSSETIILVVNANCDLGNGTFIHNTVTVSTPDPEQSTANNFSTVSVSAANPPPVIVCPADLTLEFTSKAGAVATFAPDVTDNCPGATATCTPPSGSTFPIAATTVTCTAVDSAGATASCAFTVTVLGSRGVKQNVLGDLVALRATVTDKHDGDKLDDSIQHLTRSLASEWWVDQTHVEARHGDKVFHEEKETVQKLLELIKDKKSLIPDAVLEGMIARIVKSDRLLAEVAIMDAMMAGYPAKKIAEAQMELAKGDEKAADGKGQEAIDRYEDAWKHVTRMHITAAHTTDGHPRWEMIGLPGATYVIEASTNLSDWVTVGTQTADRDGLVSFDTLSDSQFRTRFYRLNTP